MAGVLGIGADILKWEPEQLETARRLVAFYKEIRSVVFGGTSRRHGSPRENLYGIEYKSTDEDDGRIVLFVYDSDRDRSGTSPRVHPAQLDPGRRYRVESSGQIVDDALARSYGVDVPFTLAPDADILVLSPID
jgi:alpha-galactosidase